MSCFEKDRSFPPLGVISIVQRMNSTSRGWQQSEHLISKNDSANNRWHKTYCKIWPGYISLSKSVEWTGVPTHRRIIKLCVTSAIFIDFCSWIDSNMTRLFSQARYICWPQWMLSLNSECTDWSRHSLHLTVMNKALQDLNRHFPKRRLVSEQQVHEKALNITNY